MQTRKSRVVSAFFEIGWVRGQPAGERLHRPRQTDVLHVLVFLRVRKGKGRD